MAIGGTAIKICLENTDGFDRTFMQEGLALLLDSKVFALTFDIGHNAGMGGGDEAVMMKHIDKLCHMHIHDAKGRIIHLPLYQRTGSAKTLPSRKNAELPGGA